MSVGNVANWVQQPCATVGTGTLFLDGSASGAATFAMAIPLGPVWYSILDHVTGNREAGIGEYNGADSLVRTEVHATLSDGVYDPDSPSPIDLSGNSLVQCTMNAEAFRSEFSPAAADVVYDQTDDLVADTVTVQDALVQHSRGIESSEPSMSGLYSGGVLSATPGSNVFSVTVGKGIIYDSYTNPGDTDFLDISWNEFIDIPLDVSAGDFGIVRIFVNSLGQIIQFNTPLHMSMFRDYIFLGNVYYSSVNQIIEVLTTPSVIKQTASNNYDNMLFSIAIKGAEVRAVDAQLQIWNREGAIFFPNINWSQDRKNPNVATLPQIGNSTTPASLDIVDQTGTVINTVTDIPQSYNPTGVTVTALVGLKATIHRLYTIGIGVNRKLMLLLGQNEYQDASEAVSQLVLDAGNSTVPSGLSTINLLGHVCVSGNAADFSDSNLSWIVSINQRAGAGTGGSVSAPTDAIGISFNNTTSGLTATEVQGAIDEVEARTDSLESSGHTHTNSAILDATTASFLTADETKLDGIEAGATADQTTTDLGLENVDNTSDINKPVSTAQQTALDGKVDDAQVLTNVPAGALFTDTVYDDTSISAAVALNTAKVTDLVHPLVETAVPVGALFTDTVYNHPANHPPAIITQDTNNRFVTDAEKAAWSAKADTATDVGLGNVDNTSDADKPVSTAQQSALDGKVDDAQVLTNVPGGALFTDTVYDDTAIQSEVDLNTAKTGITAGQASAIIANTAKVTDLVHPLVETAVPSGAVFTDTIYDDTSISAAVALNTAKVTDLVHPLVETAVPAGAVFTDTTYTVQDGELSQVSFTTADNTKLDAIEASANNYSHPANHPASIITQDTTNRFVTDAEKSAWNAKADNKSDVGLSNVDNTSDANKPVSISQQSALDGKVEEAPENGNSYLRKDAVWEAFSPSGAPVDSVFGRIGVVIAENNDYTKAQVGLSNVDNTSDVNKPVSSAQQTALDGKIDDAQVLTNVPGGALFTDTTYSVQDGELSEISFTSADNTKLDGIEAGAKADQTTTDLGLQNVDNTSDADKPVSTVQQSALDDKVEDAPSDGQDYVRNNAAWAVSTSGAGNTNTYIQTTEPPGWSAGDLWIQTI